MSLPVGLCRICGQSKPLTDEHVPPKATPNKGRYVLATFEQAMAAGPEPITDGLKRQGGITFRTLCGDCNTNYSNRYNPELIRWFRAGDDLLRRIEWSGVEFRAPGIYPLRIIKGIVSMFLAINPEAFRLEPIGEELAGFVLDKHPKGLPAGVKVYVYFNHTGNLRYMPFTSHWRIGEAPTFEDVLAVLEGIAVERENRLSEIVFPPYGFVLTINHDKPDERLCDISRFAEADFDQRVTVDMSLAVLSVHLPLLPGDYRDLGEIRPEGRESSEGISDQGINEMEAAPMPIAITPEERAAWFAAAEAAGLSAADDEDALVAKAAELGITARRLVAIGTDIHGQEHERPQAYAVADGIVGETLGADSLEAALRLVIGEALAKRAEEAG